MGARSDGLPLFPELHHVLNLHMCSFSGFLKRSTTTQDSKGRPLSLILSVHVVILMLVISRFAGMARAEWQDSARTLMSNLTVVFIQAGFPTFLKYCVEQAKSCGYRVIVIADPSVGAEVQCEFYNMYDYFTRATDFASRYRHIGSNSKDYELFCFQRWYILRDLMDTIGGDIIALDSDVLAYPGLGYIRNFARGKKLFNVPWVNYFKTPEHLDFYLDFVDSVYRDPQQIEAISRKYLYSGTPQISDMYLFYELGELYPQHVSNIREFGPYLGIDSCIRDIAGFKHDNHHKNVSFENGIPYCDRDVGGATRFFTFHFQGISKPLMQYMHTISDPGSLSALDDLGFWFNVPGHAEVNGYSFAKAAYEFLRPQI